MASSRDAQVRENFISAELDRQSQRAQFNRTLVADGSGSATLSSAEGGLPKVSGLQLIKSQGGIWAQWSDTNSRTTWQSGW
jgi:hypothetical protein